MVEQRTSRLLWPTRAQNTVMLPVITGYGLYQGLTLRLPNLRMLIVVSQRRGRKGTEKGEKRDRKGVEKRQKRGRKGVGKG